MKQILIVGAGNIAFWYLDAIKNSKIKTKVFIYENKKEQIVKFKKRLNKRNKNIKFFNSLSGISQEIDLCIICTLSKNRFQITNKVYKKFKIKNFIIEKIIEQSTNNLNNFLKLSKKINIFVSYPFRCSKFYNYLKLKRIKKFKLIAVSKVLDFASNGIHFLDLSSWINSKKIKKIDTKKILSWSSTKRKGFKEFNGELKIYFKKGGQLSLINDNSKEGKFEIYINKNIYSVKMYSERIEINKKKIYKSNSVSISKIMKYEIDKILQNKKTKLPLYKDIHENHYLYIKYLLINYNKINKTNLKSLPIT
jgi:hypothetical protein